jgi:hypothetical protein
LAFWYVDGAMFAFKDSASYVLAFLVFGVTAFIGTPVTHSIAWQGLGPDTPEREAQMERLFAETSVVQAMKKAALIIGFTNLGAGAVNYVLNLRIVTATFNTAAFNDQVANVNAITRVVLVLPDMVALYFAFQLMYKAMYALLPADDIPGEPESGEFWNLLARREEALTTGAASAEAKARAAQQARNEFGIG